MHCACTVLFAMNIPAVYCSGSGVAGVCGVAGCFLLDPVERGVEGGGINRAFAAVTTSSSFSTSVGGSSSLDAPKLSLARVKRFVTMSSMPLGLSATLWLFIRSAPHIDDMVEPSWRVVGACCQAVAKHNQSSSKHWLSTFDISF